MRKFEKKNFLYEIENINVIELIDVDILKIEILMHLLIYCKNDLKQKYLWNRGNLSLWRW
jgi:hypothetical protein